MATENLEGLLSLLLQSLSQSLIIKHQDEIYLVTDYTTYAC